MIKHSVRFFLGNEIRAVWDNETSRWWYSATDVVSAITETGNPRIYWGAAKRRHPELFAYCFLYFEGTIVSKSLKPFSSMTSLRYFLPSPA